MTTALEYRYTPEDKPTTLAYHFCCENPACGHLIFKATHFNEHLYCPHCGGSLVLQQQLEHDLKHKKMLEKSYQFVQNLLKTQQQEEYNKLLKREYIYHFLQYNRPETIELEPTNSDNNELDDLPELTPKPASAA
ncbi:hypothetical protein L3V83_07430 [Thiotrichales bacterium 19X7-9]|nr:hypothetical protein [Thiotrichales bacterium 19X7-9]